MRRWWILLGIVVFVPVGAFAVAVLNLNRLLDENRDVIAERAQRAIGRELRFGELGVSFAGGLAVRVRDLRVGDDPAFSEGDFVSAEAVEVGVGILPALFGRIELGRAVVRSPSITVIQTDRGLSIDSLAGGGEGGPAKEGGEGEVAKEGGASRALLVSLVDIRDGSLRFVDRTVKPPAELRVEQLDFAASDVTLTDPVAFELSAAVLGAEKPNLHGSGTVGPVRADSPRLDLDLRLDPLVVDEALRLKQVASALPPELSVSGPLRVEIETRGTLAKLGFDAKLDARRAAVRYGEDFEKAVGVPLGLSLRGEKTGDDVAVEALEATIDETELRGRAAVKNLDDPAVDFAVTSPKVALASFGASDPNASPPETMSDVELEGSLRLPRAGPAAKATLRSSKGVVSGTPYQKLALELRLANRRLEIEKLSLDAFGGALSASGFYDMKNAQRPSFDLRTQLVKLRIEKIAESHAAKVARFITGDVGGTLDLRGAGSAWEQIRPTLAGDGDVRIAEGVIRDFNPAGPTLRAFMELPALSGTGIRRFLDEHPQVFGRADTPFEAIDGKLEIRDGWVQVRDFILAASDYGLAGNGRYSLENRVEFQLVMSLSQKLSEKLIAAEKSFRYLGTPQGRVALPLAVRGAPPKLAVVPDVTGVARAASRDVLTDVIDKALSGGKLRPGDAGTEKRSP